MRKYIGEYLVEKGFITSDQLKEALREQPNTGERVGAVLVRKGYISEENLVLALSEQLDIPFVDLKNYDIKPPILEFIPVGIAQRYQAIPLYRVIDTLTIAMADPLDVAVVDELRRVSSLTIRPVFATPSDIKEAIIRYYQIKREDFAKPQAAKTEGPGKKEAKAEADDEALLLKKEATKAPVIKLVDSLFEDAIKIGASDIHLEPEEKEFYVRFRLDGILQDINPIPKDLELAVISRVKIMANMDIAEKRLPQDGRIETRMLGKDVDMRVSTFPTIYGENISIRILDKSQAIFQLDSLGFQDDTLAIFKNIILKPYGIILVTGPTGSGKTTTLYGVLNTINDVKKNIITLEDPIEYVIARVRQSQVNVKAGLTFASGLRSIVRQDPDIIMIGEIRDKETAEIAIHSALTGHLVFSTLHTNDAASAASRLIDMGIEPFLVASSFCGILAQRLVRRLCPKCKKPYKPLPEEAETLDPSLASKSGLTFYKAEGCADCRQTGYKGRVGIFELLVLNDDIKEQIVKKTPAHLIRDEARKNGMRTLKEDGIDKVLHGMTTSSEVLRVAEGM
ncbi:MAG: GspE/PulE family protein [Candidatus Omnitrophica bacterium]|nr:GspE/PulE family protein [Candidatus Omnitrophota bacterium]